MMVMMVCIDEMYQLVWDGLDQVSTQLLFVTETTTSVLVKTTISDWSVLIDRSKR